jgi:hypothetical protein
MSSATIEAVNRLSPARISPPYIGTALPVAKYTMPRSASTVPANHTPAPPCIQMSLGRGRDCSRSGLAKAGHYILSNQKSEICNLRIICGMS